jgi:PEP-CTERM motif
MPSRYACSKHVFLCAVISALLLPGGRVVAATLVVDGSESDWGFSVADNNASTFVAAGGLNILGTHIEDSDDFAGDSGYVGPNLGGQNYDGEALAVALQGNDLFILIASGQRPDNGLQRFGPGDLRITTNLGTYGIEMGGGAGGGSGTMQVGGDAGSTYTLDSNGFTVSHATADAAQTAGSIWLNPSWILDPIPPSEQTQMQLGGGGTLAGNADFRSTRDSYTTQHSIFEMSIPMSLFDGRIITAITWYPSCGNDELSVSLSLPSPTVPEPGTIVLAAMAFVGLVPLVRRRRRSRG